jgi:hypothetical protein
MNKKTDPLTFGINEDDMTLLVRAVPLFTRTIRIIKELRKEPTSPFSAS